MTRKPDWQSLLEAFLEEHRLDAFEYGRWDCCLFVCDAVNVMTGVDPAARFRGTYHTFEQSRMMTRGSVRATVAATCAENGMEEVPVTLARRGDVALVKRSLGLVALNGREVILTSSKGLWRVPLSMAARAWRV